jgi:glycerol uptake facilitator-like aquaporin
MRATSVSPRSGQRTASSDAPVLLHGHQLERNLARAVTAEAVGTFVLVLAIAIGAALAVAIVISGPVSGAGVNPARAIGPMILAAQFSDWWAYLAAPLVGGAIAVALYDRVLRAGNTPALARKAALSAPRAEMAAMTRKPSV